MNLALFAERKAGRLERASKPPEPLDHSSYNDAVEAAVKEARRRLGRTLDQILCSPVHRAVFDKIAQEKAPGVRRYRLRKAALGVRKRGKLHPSSLTSCEGDSSNSSKNDHGTKPSIGRG